MFFIIAASVATGSAAPLSFLFYKGVSPINISALLGIFVLLQIILVLLTVFFSIMRRQKLLVLEYAV
jgi:hypothetical protein